MRIDVAEYITECRRISQYCQDRQTEITELKSALATFRSEMEEHFVGKTGTAIVSYLDEAIKPALEKTDTLLTDEIETMNTMINDMLEYFEEDGIIDLDYINDEYLYHFNRYSDAVSENLDEVNQITRSINDIIDLPKLNVDFPQELKHAMRKSADKVTNLVIDVDRHWQTMLDRIDAQTEEIKSLLSRIDGNNVSPMSYQSGTISLLSIGITNFEELKTLEDFDTIQEYYQYVIAKGIFEGKITVKTIDGVEYYEFNDTFYYRNYENYHEGKLVFVLGENGYEIFIVNEGNNSLAVPFGIFDPDPFVLLFNGEGWENRLGANPQLITMRTDEIPEHLKHHLKELEKMAKYYSGKHNSQKIAKLILKYLGNLETNGEKTEFTLFDLDKIATRWSGGESWRDFAGEIEGHAAILFGTWFAENFIKWADEHINKRIDKETGEFDSNGYYNAGAIADLHPGDAGTTMQDLFNTVYGGPPEHHIPIIPNPIFRNVKANELEEVKEFLLENTISKIDYAELQKFLLEKRTNVRRL